jgi:6-phosphogluconolactonase
MKRRNTFVSMTTALVGFWLFFTLLQGRVAAQQQEQASGQDDFGRNRVYAMANRADGNTILVFQRAADGTLTLIQETPTGGLGSGPGVLSVTGAPPVPAGNPLATQDSLVMTNDGRFLLAVDAGSNEISVMEVTRDGLRFVDKAPSGGNVPVAIANYGKLVYVINEGERSEDEDGARPTMTGYFLDNRGKLTPIPNSSRVTGSPDAQPGDILFSPDGRYLIITDKFAETYIHVLHVDDDATTHEVGAYVASTPAPIGAAFGHDRILGVTEANAHFINGRRTGVPNASVMSTYRLTDDGVLEPVSLSVPTFQTVACWVRFTPNGRYAYVSNKGSGSIGSFLVSPDGELTLLSSRAGDTDGLFTQPLDLSITPDGQFLYVVTPTGDQHELIIPIPQNIGTIRGYHIEEDGSLTPVGTATGFPISISGLVAR